MRFIIFIIMLISFQIAQSAISIPSKYLGTWEKIEKDKAGNFSYHDLCENKMHYTLESHRYILGDASGEGIFVKVLKIENKSEVLTINGTLKIKFFNKSENIILIENQYPAQYFGKLPLNKNSAVKYTSDDCSKGLKD